ncbi:DUF3617 domain-containing protein [Sphingomicrobium marinum]|uniref:DUF3617 domain-containing protein n=1 Tax=Sphingomicrobium marinum TaxID=1227950 RepID=UPI00223FBC25|nr:DUF3617 family protein [Sphingomicrobium marinum]
MKRILALGAALAAVMTAPAATQGGINALRDVEAGEWELTRPGTPAAPIRMCVGDPSRLAQVAHRTRQCTRVTVDEQGQDVLIHYTCSGAGFGRVKMSVVTPRSLRIETQGVAGQLPFHTTYHARRVGTC